jgi:hypothetical protein
VSVEHTKIREAVAMENGFALYRQYSEKEAACFVRVDQSTLKRWRRRGLIPYVRLGENGIRYLGVHVADLIIRGTEPWEDIPKEHSSSAPLGSPSGQAVQPGTVVGGKVPAPSALASAQRILRKPSKD